MARGRWLCRQRGLLVRAEGGGGLTAATQPLEPEGTAERRRREGERREKDGHEEIRASLWGRGGPGAAHGLRLPRSHACLLLPFLISPIIIPAPAYSQCGARRFNTISPHHICPSSPISMPLRVLAPVPSPCASRIDPRRPCSRRAPGPCACAARRPTRRVRARPAVALAPASGPGPCRRARHPAPVRPSCGNAGSAPLCILITPCRSPTSSTRTLAAVSARSDSPVKSLTRATPARCTLATMHVDSLPLPNVPGRP